MTDKNSWDIKQLQEKVAELINEWKEQKNRIEKLEKWKVATVEKLIIISEKLEELQEGDQFIKRVFITSLIGAVLSGIASVIVWAFKT